MKKLFFILFCLAASIAGCLKAEEVATFEISANDFFNTFAFNEASGSISVVENPQKTGLNKSNHCLKNVRNSGSSWTDAAQLSNSLGNPVTISNDNRYLHLYVYSDNAADGYVIFRAGANDNVWDYEHTYEHRFAFEAGAWKDIVVDLQSKNINALYGIYFLSQDWGGAPSVRNFYYDEIVLDNNPDTRSEGGVGESLQITINPNTRYQTIEGFSASDCWTANYVGKYWNDTQKNSIARWLFSQNLKADGSPEGIGLSMWRVNLGAGTMEQGAASDIEDISRRAECFLDDSGNYDWTKQAGQQWFMQKAKEYGCDQFVAFSNSPPVRYTKNGKGYSGNGNSANLQADKFDDFAGYLAGVVQHFRQEGYNFSYISPVNEPQWNWTGTGQEGSPWTNAEVKQLVVELDKSIQAKAQGTKILLPETADYNYLYSNSGHRSGNQIYHFFDPQSSNYVGNLPSVAPIIAGHSYGTHDTNANLRSKRASVKTNTEKYDIRFFQTEWSLLGDKPGENFPGYGGASYMDIALVMARVIHSDLAYAGAASWSYWTAMDLERWDHKNRFLLVALYPNGDMYGNITQSGNVFDRANLWALGNYSFFIRPGYQRIQLNGADDLAGLMGTAYVSPDGSKIVAVYVNMASSAQKIKTGFAALNPVKNPVKSNVYLTNASANLQKISDAASEGYDPEKEISIPSRSVVTVVYELETSSGIVQASKAALNIYPNPVPVGGKLHIDLPGTVAGKCSWSLYSTQGHLVYFGEQNKANSRLILNLPASLSKGVYFLQTKQGEDIYYNKLWVN